MPSGKSYLISVYIYIYGYDFKGKATICNASDDDWSFGRGCNNVCILTK